MIRGRCPICSRTFEVEKLDEAPSFPFCSERCKLIDLGRWLRGSYAIPGPEIPTETDQENNDEES